MDADRSLPRVHARVDELEETAMNENGGRCPLGGSEKQLGTTTFAVDLTFGVVVVSEVPARCGQA
jgi:hypothetical protein